MPEDLKPRLDEFTAKVVNDPAKPQGTLLLQGFLGASSLPDHTRVYSDLTLQSFVDVANADIIHIEPMPKEQSPMGGSYLWVKQDADVVPGTPTGPGTAKAKFLEGPIAAEGVAAPKPAPSPRVTVPIVACHPTIVLPACAPSIRPGSCVTETFFPTRNPCIVGTAAACQIPNPTINEVTPQLQQRAVQPAIAPTVSFCSVFCAPSQIAIHCVPHTPNCPQVAHGAAAARVAAPQGQAAPAVSAVGAVCHTQTCPTFNRCPSVAGFDCPSVNRFHCPSVANFDCPSVNEFHCPSINGFECWPTPNIQHCPTPNQICPQTLACPSFDICQTAGPNLC